MILRLWQEMKSIIILAMLLRSLSGQSLWIEINGNVSNRTSYCNGELITIFCLHSGINYIWSFSSSVDDIVVSPTNLEVNNITSGYSAKYCHENGSSLSFIASDRSNNTVISCRNTLAGGPSLSIIVNVFGSLPVPQVVVDQKATTHSSLHLRLLQTEPSAICLQSYEVRVTNQQTSYTYSSQYPVDEAGVTKVIVPNQELCKYNFSITIIGHGLRTYVSDSYVQEMQLTFEGIKWYSSMSIGMNMIRWTVDPDLSNCIAGFEFSLEDSEIRGNLPNNASSIQIDKINIHSQCDREIIVVSPIFYVRPEPLTSIGARYVITLGDDSSGYTGSHGKYKVAFTVIIVLGSIIIITLGGVIFLFGIKIKRLKLKLIDIKKTIQINKESEPFTDDTLENKMPLINDQTLYDSADPPIGMTGNSAYEIGEEDTIPSDSPTVIYESV